MRLPILLKPCLTFIVCCLFMTGAAGQGNDILELSLRAGNESNVPRGVDAQHELGSAFVGAELFAGRYFQLGLNDSLTMGVDLSSRRFNDLSGFDRLGLGVNGTYSHKFGLGAYTPVLQLSLAYELEYYRGEARDNERLTGDLTLSKRLSPAWMIDIGLSVTDSDNRHSLPMDPAVTAFGYDPDIALPYEFYDYHVNSIYVGAEYTFANMVSVSGRYQRSNGHTVASTTAPGLKTYKLSRAFYSDPAFASDWFAYLLESNSHGLSAIVSLPVGPDTGVDLSADWLQISAPGGKSYNNELYSVVLSWRF